MSRRYRRAGQQRARGGETTQEQDRAHAQQHQGAQPSPQGAPAVTAPRELVEGPDQPSPYRLAGTNAVKAASGPSSLPALAKNREASRAPSSSGRTPATDASFDAGVVVLGGAGSGVYWVADED